MQENIKNIINVYVTPKSGRDCFTGMDVDKDGNAILKVKVTAAPDGGKANISVCKIIAKEIKVPKTFVTVKRGHKSRYKQIEIKCSEQKFNS